MSSAVLAELVPVGSLSLDGLEDLPPELAAVMENRGGEELSLGGLRHLSIDTARAIYRIKAGTVFFPRLTAITPAAMAGLGGPADGSESAFDTPDVPLGIYVFDSLDIHEEALAAEIVSLEQRGYEVYYRSSACGALPPRNDYWERTAIGD
jgi:hypothetical protein